MNNFHPLIIAGIVFLSCPNLVNASWQRSGNTEAVVHTVLNDTTLQISMSADEISKPFHGHGYAVYYFGLDNKSLNKYVPQETGVAFQAKHPGKNTNRDTGIVCIAPTTG